MPTAKRDGKWESGEVIINRLCAAKYNLGFLSGFSRTADVQYFICSLLVLTECGVSQILVLGVLLALKQK